MYDGSYKNYFDWIFNWFDSYQNTKLDLLAFKNSKFLFYRFNYLLNQSNRELKKIKHSFVTDDYTAAEGIPNQNWQYFIDKELVVCKKQEIGKSLRKPLQFLIDTVENITMAKQSYRTFYETIKRSFYLTIQNLSFEEYSEIKKDFFRENCWAKHIVEELDSWISFFFKNGRFPGSQKLVTLPQIQILAFMKTEIPKPPVDLYRTFAGTDAKALGFFRLSQNLIFM